MNIYDHIREISELNDNGQLVIFVGAGVSKNVKGMPSWKELIKSMAESINYTKCNNCKQKVDGCNDQCRFIDHFSVEEFLKIPQYLFNENPELYKEKLKENVSGEIIDAKLSGLIFDILPQHIITTNYDKLLESSNNINRLIFDVVCNDKELISSDRARHIIKMHGDISDIDSIVLKESDYLNYSQKKILIETFIKSLMINHTFVFLGYSLNDNNIKQIISWINYLKEQNGLAEKKTLGYLVLDDATVSQLELDYYARSGIQIININKLVPCESSPSELEEIGKRLYTFLLLIKDESLYDSYNREAVFAKKSEYLSKYPFISYRKLLKYIGIKSYKKISGTLQLHNVEDYKWLVTKLQSENSVGTQIRRLFLNAEINWLTLFEPKCSHRIIQHHNAQLDELNYNIYLENRYYKLYETIIKGENDFEKLFYINKMYPYSKQAKEILNDIGANVSVIDNIAKLQYTYNNTLMKSSDTYTFNWKDYDAMFSSILNNKEKELFRFFSDIRDTNKEDLEFMQSKLSKLIDHYKNFNTIFAYGGDLSILYDIQNIAYEYYVYHYEYFIFSERFYVVRGILSPYIEAMLCTNGNRGEAYHPFDERKKRNVDRYGLNRYDIDMIIKYIDSKTLELWIRKHEVKQLNINNPEGFIQGFINLIDSLIKIPNGFYLGYEQMLSNYLIVCAYCDLTDIQLEKIMSRLVELFDNKDRFDIYFARPPYYRDKFEYFIRFVKLANCKTTHLSIVKILFSSSKFFSDIYPNVGSYHINELNCLLAIGENEEELDINTIFESVEDIAQKIIIIGCMKDVIARKNLKDEYKKILQDNYNKIPMFDLLGFIFGDWIDVNEEVKKYLLSLVISNSRVNNTRSFPDYLLGAIEIVVVCHLKGKIKDINSISMFRDEDETLDFLIEPNTFDYSKVDLSNYKWQNIANCKKYKEILINHKKDIIKTIQKHIEVKTVSRFELGFLFKFLVEEEEMWKYM